MSENKPNPPSGFKIKMGRKTCEVSHITGTVVSPDERTLVKTTTSTNSDGRTETYTSHTQLQDFHLQKDNGREISVKTTNEQLNLRDGHRLSLIRCKVGDGETYNLGFVNHHTDEAEILLEDWAYIYTPNKLIGIAIYLISIVAMQNYLQGDLIFAIVGGLILGFVVSKVVLIYAFLNPSLGRLQNKLDIYMQALKEYGDKLEFHKY